MRRPKLWGRNSCASCGMHVGEGHPPSGQVHWVPSVGSVCDPCWTDRPERNPRQLRLAGKTMHQEGP